MKLGILLVVGVCVLSGCVGGSRGTGVRTFEPSPDSEDGVIFPWDGAGPCDARRDERCARKPRGAVVPPSGDGKP